MHQLGSQAWPAPHCQGENCTKCQEVSCAVPPRHGQGTALRGLQKDSVPWVEKEKGLIPIVLPVSHHLMHVAVTVLPGD